MAFFIINQFFICHYCHLTVLTNFDKPNYYKIVLYLLKLSALFIETRLKTTYSRKRYLALPSCAQQATYS